MSLIVNDVVESNFKSCICFSPFRVHSILKSIEFPHLSSTADDDQDITKSDKVSTPASAGGNKPLEVLLLERNKALQSENTALKVANSELQGKASSTWIDSNPSRLLFLSLNHLKLVFHRRVKVDYVCEPFSGQKRSSLRNVFPCFLFAEWMFVDTRLCPPSVCACSSSHRGIRICCSSSESLLRVPPAG